MTPFSRELPHSFGDALRVCREILSGEPELVRKGTIESESEQIVIAAHRAATGEKLSRAEFYARTQDRLPETSAQQVLIFSGKRKQGSPLQHILGYQVFLDHEYEVDPSTLIPRPETEVLVDVAKKRLRNPTLGLEVGLGTGIISIELLSAIPGLRMIATEISESAVNLARRNAERILGSAASRLEVRMPRTPLEVLESFGSENADFLISNPPYLDPKKQETENEVLRHEPKAALFPESGDPLHFYRAIATQASALLRPKGIVFLEIAAERAYETADLFGEGWQTTFIPDLTGRLRVLVAQKEN